MLKNREEHNTLWWKLGFMKKPALDYDKILPSAKLFVKNWNEGLDKFLYPDLVRHFKEQKFENASKAFYTMDEAVLMALSGEDYCHLKTMMLGISTWHHGEDIVPDKPLKPHAMEWLASLEDKDVIHLKLWYEKVSAHVKKLSTFEPFDNHVEREDIDLAKM